MFSLGNERTWCPKRVVMGWRMECCWPLLATAPDAATTLPRCPLGRPSSSLDSADSSLETPPGPTGKITFFNVCHFRVKNKVNLCIYGSFCIPFGWSLNISAHDTDLLMIQASRMPAKRELFHLHWQSWPASSKWNSITRLNKLFLSQFFFRLV